MAGVRGKLTRATRILSSFPVMGQSPRLSARVSMAGKLVFVIRPEASGKKTQRTCSLQLRSILIPERRKSFRAVLDTQPFAEMQWRHESALTCGEYEGSNEALNHVKSRKLDAHVVVVSGGQHQSQKQAPATELRRIDGQSPPEKASAFRLVATQAG